MNTKGKASTGNNFFWIMAKSEIKEQALDLDRRPYRFDNSVYSLCCKPSDN